MSVLRSPLLLVVTLAFAWPVRAVELYPLERVHKGLEAEGQTVLAGDEMTRFGVTVLGVLPDFIGPGQDLILARLKGPAIEYTGVISGMSGSPVYVDGKLLGAVSYRLGAFSKEPIAGITPAELMFASASATPSRRWASREAAELDGLGPLQRIDTPLQVSGAPAGLLDRYGAALREHGLQPVRGGSAGRKPPRKAQTMPFTPGGAMAGVLVAGDLTLAATGTVTAVSDQQILGFGHSFLGRGRSRMPLATAEVVTTLPSLAGSSKLSNVTGLVGTLRHDRSVAVAGELGPLPPMVELVVALHGPAAAMARDPLKNYRFQVVHDPALTPLLIEISLASALGGRIGFDSGGSAAFKLQMQVNDLPELVVEDRVSVDDAGSSAAAVAAAVSKRVAPLWGNAFQPLERLKIQIEVRLDPEPQHWKVVAARISPPVLRAGEAAAVEVEMQDYRGRRQRITGDLAVPADLAPGEVKLHLGSADHLADIDKASGRWRTPTSVADLVANLRQQRRSDRLYLVLSRADPGLRIEGRALPALPPSMRAVLGRGSAGSLREGVARHVLTEQALTPARVIRGGVDLTLQVLAEESRP